MTHAAFTPQHDAGWYEIRIQGRLDPRWAPYLDGVHLTPDVDGTTVLRGNVIDQAALHGLLASASRHRPAAYLGRPRRSRPGRRPTPHRHPPGD